MIEDPVVYYSCSDCVTGFVEAAENGVCIDPTTDHARCFTCCCAKATFVCRVYPGEQETAPKESCKAGCNMTVTDKAEDVTLGSYLCVEHTVSLLKDLENGGHVSLATDLAKCYREACAKTAEFYCVISTSATFRERI